MGFLDHLEELRKPHCLFHSSPIVIGFFGCWGHAGHIYRPHAAAHHGRAAQATACREKLVYVNPVDPFNLYLKVGAMAGLFVDLALCALSALAVSSRPAFIATKSATSCPSWFRPLALFLAGGYFGYSVVLSAGARVPHRFWQRLPADDHARGIQFAIPDPHRRHGRNFRNAHPGIFSRADGHRQRAAGCGTTFAMPSWASSSLRPSSTPTPDILNMCIFAAPMLGLVCPEHRDRLARASHAAQKRAEKKESRIMRERNLTDGKVFAVKSREQEKHRD